MGVPWQWSQADGVWQSMHRAPAAPTCLPCCWRQSSRWCEAGFVLLWHFWHSSGVWQREQIRSLGETARACVRTQVDGWGIFTPPWQASHSRGLWHEAQGASLALAEGPWVVAQVAVWDGGRRPPR